MSKSKNKKRKNKYMSDTPETDKNTWSDSCDGILHKVVTSDFAKRLERERDEARELAHRFRSLYYTQLGIESSASWFPWEVVK